MKSNNNTTMKLHTWLCQLLIVSGLGFILYACSSELPIKFGETPTYTVTIDANGGTLGCTTSFKVKKGETVPGNVTGLPTREGYTLSTTWKIKGKCTCTDFIFCVTPVNEDIIIEAQWIKNENACTVTIDANGGTLGTTKTISVERGGIIPANTAGLPTREGYTLSTTWKTQGSPSTDFIFGTTPVTGNITIVAQWTKNAYTVTIDANGGTGGVASVAVDQGGTVPTNTAVPTIRCFNLSGWKTKETPSRDFVFGTTPVTGNITIVAQWTSQAVVTTFAGSGIQDFVDAAGTQAGFRYPAGVAVDALGNVYVADFRNHCIRKISPSGVVTTFAGSGRAEYADGTGTAASFNGPYGVAVDGSGNVYVADYDNHLIRKISPSGVVTTFAGSGRAGYADGTGTAASFNNPYGVAVDGSSNVYVADGYNHRIRKINPAGVVTTLAGSGTASFADGTGTAASFNFPAGIAVDASGNVFVSDYYNHRIRKINPAGVVTTLAGSGTAGKADGTGTQASFNGIHDIELDAFGNIYMVEYYNHLVRRVSPAGVVTTLAGSGTARKADGTGTQASFNRPMGVAVDGSGNVFIADADNHLIRKISCQ